MIAIKQTLLLHIISQIVITELLNDAYTKISDLPAYTREIIKKAHPKEQIAYPEPLFATKVHLK